MLSIKADRVVRLRRILHNSTETRSWFGGLERFASTPSWTTEDRDERAGSVRKQVRPPNVLHRPSGNRQLAVSYGHRPRIAGL